MDKPLVSFSIENFITVGLIAALWYVVIVGGAQLMRGVVAKRAES
ncbi:MAG: hypothetical protein AB7K41_14505 [Bdellovibrionales bacterium]